MEGRVPMVLPVYLLDDKRGPQPAELALTENVSSSGARVVTKWRREPGDPQRITLLSGETLLTAQVVYCHPVPKSSFCVGLKLTERCAGWWNAQPAPVGVAGSSAAAEPVRRREAMASARAAGKGRR
jgi:hypothetical protein